MSLNVVFMGTPEFSVPTIEALLKNNYNILAAYTQPPKQSKRGQKINQSSVEIFCRKKKIKIKTPINLSNKEEFKIFLNFSPDVVVVVAYGQIIPKNFLNIPKFGFINIHASLLPKWRGAAPIQRAIMNGDKNIGVSIMQIKEKLDSGPVLFSEKIELKNEKTHGEIEKKISVIGADLLIKGLKNIEDGNAKFIEQIHSDATYAKKIKKSETKIDWKQDANKVLAHIHGLSPSPGAWFELKNERFKVLKAKISQENGKSGYVLDENLTVGCGSGSIQILELQRQGKNIQTTKEFLKGKKISKGTILT